MQKRTSVSPQFIRTDKAITQALISLLEEKPFEKITIQDILDETPVTRSTFYKHFHDKHEIAERMQEEFSSSLLEMRQEHLANSISFSPKLLKISRQNRELMSALLKIHTENVDLRQSIGRQCEQYYLANNSGPHRITEARVYAQALVAFLLSDDLPGDYTMDYMDGIFLNVTLMLLGIPHNKEAHKYLQKCIRAKHSPR